MQQDAISAFRKNLNDLEEIVMQAKRVPLSNMCMVDRERILGLANAITTDLPTVFAECEGVVQNQITIISEANERAEQTKQNATMRANQYVTDAKNQAQQMTAQAQQQAQEMLKKAQQQAAGMVREAQEQAIRVLPVLLFVNSMRNQLSIPPTFINAEQLINLFGLRDTARQFGRPQSVFDSSFNPLTFSTTVKYLAFFAGQEWLRHMRFLEWDPKQAEQDAKDEDERKSREALAKKYNLTSDGDNAASDADLDSSADSNLSEDSDSSEEAGSEPTEE